ncbi:MAG: hypothetical protein KBH07_05045 [Flavobacteriales bacterium]|nr:hypothetical protein [Flavobacteriales bacterium]MBP9080902.1 hypothetical protein [Flavobacteriales bacterium]
MTKHITGIGGLFFRVNDHKALAKWYNDHFGINDQEHGSLWQLDTGPGLMPALQASYRQRMLEHCSITA